MGRRILPVILVALPATMVLTAQTSFGEPTADSCRTSPGVAAAPGMHWHYHLEGTNQRQCWYLRSEGAPVHAGNDAASSSPRHEHAAAQNEAAPDRTAAARSQLAVAQTNSLEASTPAPSAHAQPAGDFGVRWVELPKALNLDAHKLAPPSNGYAAESAATSGQQPTLPALIMRGSAREARQNPADPSGFATTLLATVLGMALLALCHEALKLGGALHREVKRQQAGVDVFAPTGAGRGAGVWWRSASRQKPRSGPAAPPIELSVSPSDLVSVLQQADAEPHTPRSFAPSGDRMTKAATDRRISPSASARRRTHSARHAARRQHVMA